VRVKPALPAVALFGESVVTVGRAAAVTEKLVPDGVLPPSGFVTVTGIVAAVRPRSLVVIAAVTCDELTKVVVLLVPFHWTVAPETKPEPFTVRVKPAPAATAVLGEREVIVGELTGGGVVVDDLLPLLLHPIPVTRRPDKADDNNQRRLCPRIKHSQGKRSPLPPAGISKRFSGSEIWILNQRAERAKGAERQRALVRKSEAAAILTRVI
jgi:hypothetical protein